LTFVAVDFLGRDHHGEAPSELSGPGNDASCVAAVTFLKGNGKYRNHFLPQGAPVTYGAGLEAPMESRGDVSDGEIWRAVTGKKRLSALKDCSPAP
jgi:hypothetical protein